MEMVLEGKAKDVFSRLAEMKAMADRRGGVIYTGRRMSHGARVFRMEISAEGLLNTLPLDPAPSRRLYDHSLEFEWGYLGSGAAQLALALLYDATGDPSLSLACHQAFKEAFVAGWRRQWQITADQIRRWVLLKSDYSAFQWEYHAED